MKNLSSLLAIFFISQISWAQLQQVNLPLAINFENANGVYNSNTTCIFCDSSIFIDYYRQFNFFSVTFNEGISSSLRNPAGSRALTLKGGAPLSVNAFFHGVVATIDFSNYDTSDAGDILFSYDEFVHFDEPDSGEVIQIRGSLNDNWLYLHSLQQLQVVNTWFNVKDLNLTETLEKGGQNFSASFQLRIQHRDNSTGLEDDGRSFDEFLFEYETCPPPSSVKTYPDTNGLTLRWHKAHLADSTEIIYGPVGFFNGGPFTGPSITTVTDTLFLNSLAKNSSYEFWLRSKCGGNGSWIGPIRVHTVLTAPFFEDFNAGPSQPLFRFFDSIYIRDNWKISNGNSDYVLDSSSTIQQWQWSPDIPVGQNRAFSQAGRGPGAYMITNFDHANVAYLELAAPIDISTLTNPELRFSSITQGGPSISGNLAVEINTGSGWNQIFSKTSARPVPAFPIWQDDVVSLASYSGIIKLRFKCERSGSFVAIDEVAIDKPLTCPSPYALVQTGSSANTASFSFNTDLPGNYPFEISFGPSLSDPSLGTKVIVLSNSPTLDSLQASTNYCMFVRAICAPGDTSYWSKPFCFSTQCNVNLSAPYFNGFEGTSLNNLPNCWLALGAEDTAIMVVDSADRGLPLPNGTRMLEINESPVPNILCTPVFSDLTSGLNQVRFKFAYEQASNISNRDSLFLGLLSDSFDLSSFRPLSYLKPKAPYNQFQEVAFRLSDSALISGQSRIAFRYGNTDPGSFEYYIEDFHYEPIPCSPAPTNFTVIDSACEALTLDWTSPFDTVQLEYGPKGFTLGTGNTIVTGTKPHVFNGLSNFQEYDFYITNLCAAADSGLSVGPISGKPDKDAQPEARIIVVTDQVNPSTGEWTLEVDGSSSIDADSYLWSFLNSAPHAPFPRVTKVFPQRNYPAQITLYVSNNCGLSDTLSISYDPLNIKESQILGNVKIYPNPTPDGFITVDLGEEITDFNSLTIYNSLGQIIANYHFNGQQESKTLTLSIADVSGVYIIQLLTNSGESNFYRVVKK